MKIVHNTIKIGLKTPVRVLHASDTHIARADLRDGLRKVDLATERAHYFSEAENCLNEISRISKEMNLPIMYTGDLIDFVSIANLSGAKEFIDNNDCFFVLHYIQHWFENHLCKNVWLYSSFRSSLLQILRQQSVKWSNLRY